MVFSVIHRLAKGLAKSRERLGDMIDLAVGRGVFDDAAAEGIEEALILADAGPEQAAELTAYLRQWVQDAGGGLSVETVKEALAIQIARMLDVTSNLPSPDASNPPIVTLIVGVNGTGKTTTAAKIAARDIQEGRKIVLGAADTFRAAASDQLKIWGERIGAAGNAVPISFGSYRKMTEADKEKAPEEPSSGAFLESATRLRLARLRRPTRRF